MHQNWDPERFAAALREVQALTGLRQQDIARMAGRSRPQVSRWLTGAHRPDYDSLRQLAESLHGRPGLNDLPAQLMQAAGYDGSGLAADLPRPGYDDPALRAIWDIEGLTYEEKRGMVALALGMREERKRGNGTEGPGERGA